MAEHGTDEAGAGGLAPHGGLGGGLSGRLAFRLGADDVGWVTPGVAAVLEGLGCVREGGRVTLADAGALQDVARLASRAVPFRWRDEAFDVRARPDGAVLGRIDRGALPVFGIVAEGVHMNGLVRKPDGWHLWVARRSLSKALDPGKLDHLVAGGIPAGLTALQTLVKEGAEEAGLPEDLARQAVYRGVVSYTIEREEGLRRDRLHCYDLVLPDGFVPVAHDGEVEEFALWPLARVRDAVENTDDFKFNVTMVLNELFARLDGGNEG